jgi:hypothetical protein
MLGNFFKSQSGKIRIMNGKRSSSFPTDVCRTAPDFEPDTQTSMNPTERGLNLLNQVPTSRTCEDAGILPHWYTCSQQTCIYTFPIFNKKIINVTLFSVKG